jgi:hypothetical protein
MDKLTAIVICTFFISVMFVRIVYWVTYARNQAQDNVRDNLRHEHDIALKHYARMNMPLMGGTNVKSSTGPLPLDPGHHYPPLQPPKPKEGESDES